MREGLREIVKRCGYPCTVAGFGSVYTVYFMPSREINNYDDLLGNDKALYIRYRQELMQRGIFEIPMNLKRNHLSYSHTDEDVETSLAAAEDSLKVTFNARAAQQV
jgi:glutamate-1-semialdehyde 2,1-aminomutase